MDTVSILLFKQPSAGEMPDKYLVRLSAHPLCRAVYFLPVLDISTVPRGEVELQEVLTQPSPANNYGGVIITSARASESVVACISRSAEHHRESVAALWSELPWYVVGAASARALAPAGIRSIVGDGTGSAAALVELLRAEDRLARTLLFVCGNLRRDTVPSAVTKSGGSLHEIVTYETKAVSALELPSAWEASSDERWAVFFSPSGVQCVSALGVLPVGIKLLAIGKTTAAEMARVGLAVDAVAARPDADAVVQAICEVSEDAQLRPQGQCSPSRLQSSD